MEQRRVAVLYSHALFGEGLARILDTDGGLAVSCVRADPGHLPAEIEELKPDAIIVEENADETFMRELLRCLPPVLLIRVCLEDNVMEVYNCRHVLSACPDDLLQVIRVGACGSH
jgi:hypothetical protein